MGQLMRTTSSDKAVLRKTACLLRSQLPIRFARRIEDILKLPHVVVSNPRIGSVLSTYLETFESLRRFPVIECEQDEIEFLKIIRDQLHKNNGGTQLIAEGCREVRRMYPEIKLDKFLHDHFTTRIATRILMDNYSEMRTPQPGSVGVVCQGMRPLGVVEDIVGEIADLTRSLYGCTPAVEYRGNLDCVLDYIPRHIQYMVRELLKNAFRATVERHRTKDILPPVIVELQQGDTHVIVKISDQGGGMTKQAQQEAWQFGWTTVKNGGVDRCCTLGTVHDGQDTPCQQPVDYYSGGMNRRSQSELAGYGFGLPLTRLFAQYFGGDVFLQPLPGHGTDVYLVLTHLKIGTDSTEIDDLSTVLYSKEQMEPKPILTV